MSFWELFIVGVIGLLVIGPDKLPQTIKTTLTWFGRVKRMLNETRSEFEKQLGVDEIRREIHNEQVMESLKSLKVAQEKIKQEANSINQSVKDAQNAVVDEEDEGIFGEQHHNHPPVEKEKAAEAKTPKEPS